MPDLPASRRVALALSALMRGVHYTSEGEYPYRPFTLAYSPDLPLDEATLRRRLRVSDRMKVDFYDIAEFFADHQRDEDEDDPGEGYRVAAYVLLEQAMRATLEELVYVSIAEGIGGYGRDLFIGRARDGNLAGLQSNSYV